MSDSTRVPYRGLITASAMLAMFMQTLDSTIANVALPYMQGSMSASYDEITSNRTLRCSPQRIIASGMRAVALRADLGTAPLPLSGRQPFGLPRNRFTRAPVSPVRMAPCCGDSAA